MADISRADVAGLIADEYAPGVLSAAEAASVVLSAFGTVPMGTKTIRMPVVAALPSAGFVSESATDASGAKPTSKVIWSNKDLVAEEIAVIIPVHENVIDDATEDILDDIAKLGGQAIGKVLDAAVMFGVGKPASWTSADLVAAATAAGNIAQVGAAGTDEDLGGSFYKAAELVADDGFDPSAVLAKLALKFRLANLRNANGDPIFIESLSAGVGDGSIAGLTAHLNRNGAWDSTLSEGIVVDPALVKIGVRQDITVKFLDQATVGGINLAERDMVALRFKARYAYVLGEIMTSEGEIGTPVANVVPAVVIP